jgi:hypothetical protein
MYIDSTICTKCQQICTYTDNMSTKLQILYIYLERAVFGSYHQWARKPQNYPITASYIDGLTPRIR